MGYPQQMRVTRFISSQMISTNNASYVIIRMYPLRSYQPSRFLLYQPFHYLLGLPFLPSKSNANNAIMAITPNTVCQRELIHCCIQTQHQQLQVDSSFPPLSCNPHTAITMDLDVILKISISTSFRHHVSLPLRIAGLT